VAGAGGVLSHDVAGDVHGLWIPEPRSRLVHVRTPGAGGRWLDVRSLDTSEGPTRSMSRLRRHLA